MNSNIYDNKKKSGIYYIKNKVNNKIYIGQTKDIDGRRKEHKRDLKANRHVNWHLQKAFEKYGDSNFEFGILEYCEIDELDNKEVYYINKYKTMNRDKGYNLKSGGDRITFSQETLNKMSKTRKELCQDKTYLIQMCWARSELSEQQVIEIKTMLYNDVSIKNICNQLNVTYNQVRHIKDNNSFSFILPKYNYYIKNREVIYRKRNKRNIMRLYREGYSFKDIANKLNINPVTPYRIVKEESTIHDERCRNNAIAKSYKKRNSLIKTLHSMGYSAIKISKVLKVSKNIVYKVLNNDYQNINYGGKLDVYKYKKAKVIS